MVLTSTKSHGQFMPALKAVDNSLQIYGHSPIEAIFTDNPRADKPELESAIPSLRKDIVPVPDPSSLEELTLPTNSVVLSLSSSFQVNTRLDSIMEHLKESGEIFVGFDAEWAVSRSTGIHAIRIALLSLTHKKDIYLIPVCIVSVVTQLTNMKLYSSHPICVKDIYTFHIPCLPSSEHHKFIKLGSKFLVT